MHTQAHGVTQKFLDANHFITVQIDFFLLGAAGVYIFERLVVGSAIRVEGHERQINKAAACISLHC